MPAPGSVLRFHDVVDIGAHGVGQSADATWQELKSERGPHVVSGPKLRKSLALDDSAITSSLSPKVADTPSAGSAGLTLMHWSSNSKKKPDTVWPTATVVGDQLSFLDEKGVPHFPK